MSGTEVDAVVEAYSKSRYWRGMKDVNGAMAKGLLVALAESWPGHADPQSGKKGGMICLATKPGVADAYGTVFRVFLDHSRGGALQGIAVQGHREGRFGPGNAMLWRDTDNDSAVATWADIPPTWLWRLGLQALTEGSPTNDRVRAIFTNIGSFMDPPCTDVALLQGLMLQALAAGRLQDHVNESPESRNWIAMPPRTQAQPSVVAAPKTKKSHGCIIL